MKSNNEMLSKLISTAVPHEADQSSLDHLQQFADWLVLELSKRPDIADPYAAAAEFVTILLDTRPDDIDSWMEAHNILGQLVVSPCNSAVPLTANHSTKEQPATDVQLKPSSHRVRRADNRTAMSLPTNPSVDAKWRACQKAAYRSAAHAPVESLAPLPEEAEYSQDPRVALMLRFGVRFYECPDREAAIAHANDSAQRLAWLVSECMQAGSNQLDVQRGAWVVSEDIAGKSREQTAAAQHVSLDELEDAVRAYWMMAGRLQLSQDQWDTLLGIGRAQPHTDEVAALKIYAIERLAPRRGRVARQL